VIDQRLHVCVWGVCVCVCACVVGKAGLLSAHQEPPSLGGCINRARERLLERRVQVRV